MKPRPSAAHRAAARHVAGGHGLVPRPAGRTPPRGGLRDLAATLHVVATTVSIVRPAARCVYSECIGGSRTRRGRADGLLSPPLEGRSSNDTATGYCPRAGARHVGILNHPETPASTASAAKWRVSRRRDSPSRTGRGPAPAHGDPARWACRRTCAHRRPCAPRHLVATTREPWR